MRSKTSFFNPTLFWKNITRFWPIWASYLVIWFFLIPLSLMLTDNDYSTYSGLVSSSQGHFALVTVLWLTQTTVPALCLVYGLISAMALFSYLFQGRAVNLMHALPIRREGLFLTNYLSGLAFTLAPALAVALITLVAEITLGCTALYSLGIWLLIQVCCTFFFFSFAVFCAMFTGNLLALPVFYLILNFLALGLYYLCDLVLATFVFGMSSISGAVFDAASHLSPGAYLCFMNPASVDVDFNVNHSPLSPSTQNILSVTFQGVPIFLCYAGVGLVLAVIALLLYRVRRSERAGDLVSVAPVRPVFQYGVALCAALALGTLLYHTFLQIVPHNGWSMLLFLLIGGALGYTVAAMLLKKTFRVFCSRFFLGLAGLAVVLTGGIAAMELDLTGFERWVPASSHVSAVVVNASGMLGSNLVFEDEEDIQAVLQVHQSIVDLRQEIQEQLEDNYTEFYLDLQYTMEDGRVVKRSYQVPSSTHPALVQLTQQVADFLNSPGSVAAAYRPLFQSEDPLRTIEINFYDLGEDYLFSGEDAQMLSQALKEDIQAGRIRVAYTGQSPTYYSILLTLEYADSSAPDAIQDLYLQPDAQSTLEALETLGLGESVDTSFSQSS